MKRNHHGEIIIYHTTPLYSLQEPVFFEKKRQKSQFFKKSCNVSEQKACPGCYIA